MDVTIEGSSMPCVGIKPGEQRTVRFDARVASMVDRGYVTIVKRHDDEEKADPVEEKPDPEPVEVYADYQAALSRVEAGLPAQDGDDEKLAAGDGVEETPKRRRRTSE